MPDLLEKPVRTGSTYCAPFCGRGCTWAEYQTAKRKSRELVALLGKGWKPRVWENLGWHYSAVSPGGWVKVHPSDKRTYMAFLGESDIGGQWASGHFRHPKDCVADVVNTARTEAEETLKQIKLTLEGIEAI